MALNHEQLDVLSSAVILARAGTGVTVEDEAKRALCDGLVESGHLVVVPGVEGGYQVSEQFAQAMGVITAVRAEQVKDN
jgi:hypothetical protein